MPSSLPLFNPKDLTDLQKLIEQNQIEFIRFEQADTHGISRSKTIPIGHFESFTRKGLNFPLPPLGQDVQGIPAPHTGYLEERGFSDALLFPDLKTFQNLPWLDKTARVLCDPYFRDGNPVMAASRWLVKHLLNQLEEMGYRLLSSFEYEFYLVNAQTRQPTTPGVQNFVSLGLKFDEALIYRMLRYISKVGIDILAVNAEHAPGQIEITYAAAWGIEAADQAFTFKNGIKEIAHQSGMIASFMTKPLIKESANGCHYNQSLWRNNTNAFFDPEKENGISDICRHYLAGQLAHAKALSAIAAPTINCLKRFKSNSGAPINATWGLDNRTTAIRAKAFGDENVHLENRLAGGSVNPYLIMAGSLAAGIHGIQRQLEPPCPILGSAYDLPSASSFLPQRLEQALDALESDKILQAFLGKDFIQLFIALKRHEIRKARSMIKDYDSSTFLERVDEWELEEFFQFL